MIEKIRIQGYRIYRDVTIKPNPRLNLIVGANESGKSTLMEAVALALTGRINGRRASEELNPHWFNIDAVQKFLRDCQARKRPDWPKISIELFLTDRDDLQHLCGAVNTDTPTNACPGITLRVIPNPDYADALDEWLQGAGPLLPVEYYMVDWRSFADAVITVRPQKLATAVIDSRTVRSSSGVDYHLRQILSDRMEPAERAQISLAYRKIKASLSEEALHGVNERMSTVHASLHDQPIGLAMDQTARTSWEGAVTPHVSGVPFSMSGQGQQAAIKISLAMNRHSASAAFVLIEEPENHLTHTSLRILLSRVADLAGPHQQLFISTHSSFVLNRLGVDALQLLGGGGLQKMSKLTDDTVAYFKKLPGYDTLRMVLARKIVLVEGPSDEMVFERVFRQMHGKLPIEVGVDVLTMRGLSLKRCLELCAALDKTVAALRDNDGTDPADLRAPLEQWLKPGTREVFIGDLECGETLEPQLLHHNGEEKLRAILKTGASDLVAWMGREKTEAALRLADSEQDITPPSYMHAAASFIHG